ncbi:unnamed protein product [Vicia faba]|uniref:Uncharacterized protein n=1 Tax=Vicia faba TaxID=3906 RepID=A0AAV0ZTH3_VICFA|nr:unnamed protein product [Vicia faba]
MPGRFRDHIKEAPNPPLKWPWFLAMAFLVYAWRAVLFELSNWKNAAFGIVRFIGYVFKYVFALLYRFIGNPITCTIRSIEDLIYGIQAFYSWIITSAPVPDLTIVIFFASVVLAIAETTVPNCIRNPSAFFLSSRPYHLTNPPNSLFFFLIAHVISHPLHSLLPFFIIATTNFTYLLSEPKRHALLYKNVRARHQRTLQGMRNRNRCRDCKKERWEGKRQDNKGRVFKEFQETFSSTSSSHPSNSHKPKPHLHANFRYTIFTAQLTTPFPAAEPPFNNNQHPATVTNTPPTYLPRTALHQPPRRTNHAHALSAISDDMTAHHPDAAKSGRLHGEGSDFLLLLLFFFFTIYCLSRLILKK